jgi:hypothetical protein
VIAAAPAKDHFRLQAYWAKSLMITPTTSIISPNASTVERPLSSPRPPWFETMIPSMVYVIDERRAVDGRLARIATNHVIVRCNIEAAD